jgi:hypothetical protein
MVSTHKVGILKKLRLLNALFGITFLTLKTFSNASLLASLEFKFTTQKSLFVGLHYHLHIS